MKKFISIILIGIMLLSMTACNQPKDSSDWTTKIMANPSVTVQTKDVTYTTEDGKEFPDTVIVSPLNKETYQPEKALNTLKKLKFLNHWTLFSVQIENMGYHFTNHGKLKAYNDIDTIVMRNPADAENQHDTIKIDYATESMNIIGYRCVTVTIENTETVNLTQAQIYEILQAVYGKKDAEFLCYATGSFLKEPILSETTQNGANVTYSRTMNEDEMIFSIDCDVTDSYAKHYYSNNKEAMLKELVVFPDVMHWKDGEDDINNLDTLGKSFLEKHFGPDACFVTENNPDWLNGIYIYRVPSDESQPKEFFSLYQIAPFGIENAVRQEISMVSWVTKDKVESMISLDLCALTEEECTDAKKEEITVRAQEIVKDILQVETFSDPLDKKKCYPITIDGQESYIAFQLWFPNYDDDYHDDKVTLWCITSTDAQLFESE